MQTLILVRIGPRKRFFSWTTLFLFPFWSPSRLKGDWSAQKSRFLWQSRVKSTLLLVWQSTCQHKRLKFSEETFHSVWISRHSELELVRNLLTIVFNAKDGPGFLPQPLIKPTHVRGIPGSDRGPGSDMIFDSADKPLFFCSQMCVLDTVRVGMFTDKHARAAKRTAICSQAAFAISKASKFRYRLTLQAAPIM